MISLLHHAQGHDLDIWANHLVGKSSMRRKLLGYYHAREQKRHTHLWGFKSFRVLTVTTSEQRIRNMIDAQRRVAPHCPPGLFLYKTLEAIERHGALGPAWITSKNENVSLIDEKQKSQISEFAAPIIVDDTAPFRQRRTAGVKPTSNDTASART